VVRLITEKELDASWANARKILHGENVMIDTNKLERALDDNDIGSVVSAYNEIKEAEKVVKAALAVIKDRVAETGAMNVGGSILSIRESVRKKYSAIEVINALDDPYDSTCPTTAEYDLFLTVNMEKVKVYANGFGYWEEELDKLKPKSEVVVRSLICERLDDG
jgi:hypothetical protein